MLRPLLRIVVAVAFAFALVGAAVMTASGSRITDPHSFSHKYPPDRTSFERPKVHGPAPRAARKDTLAHGVRVTSLAALAQILPARTLRRAGSAWLLTKPVDVTDGAALVLRGGTLELAPRTFLQARDRGTLQLRDMTVAAVDAHGLPLTQPAPGRAFLAGRDGGRLVLVHDRILDLGHLGVVSYGIALRQPAPGSRVTGSTVEGNYFGVFMSHADGVVVARNRISHSAVYGVDPYGHSRNVSILDNVVTSSGLHAIVLADGVSGTRVVGNTVRGAGGHGIVLYKGSWGNVLAGNSIRGSFDGIVLTDSPRNRISRNRVGPVVRFGLRISGASSGNVVAHNTFSHALLAAYLYGGATGNRLLDNVFAANRENVRVRSDAPGNTVTPRPSLSEGVG